MNVYDFDGTIYQGDSSIDFLFFELRRKPLLVRFLPSIIVAYILYKFHLIDTKRFKEIFFLFTQKINVVYEVRLFWEQHQSKIRNWFLLRRKSNDAVISASPDFLLRPICEQLGINVLIATQYDIHHGTIIGENCKGEEKYKRWKQLFNEEEIDHFYSDSLSDSPLAQKAHKAFFVQDTSITPWGKNPLTQHKEKISCLK